MQRPWPRFRSEESLSYTRYPKKFFTHPDKQQHGGRKPTETAVTDRVLLEKREFILRGIHKH